MLPSPTYLTSPILILVWLMPAWVSAGDALQTRMILERMEAAYAEVKDYQAEMEVRNYRRDGSFKTQKFLYTFKKPKWIRLVFESPHAGMVLVYPDQNGKVVVRLPELGWKLHLAPDNALVQGPGGQHINQTDLGLLIKNIAHSLTDQRRGPVEVFEKDGEIGIQVLADDHFRRGVITLYRFVVDTNIWLPVQVEESTPEGRLERKVFFRNIRTNIRIPDNFFQLDE